MNREIKFRGQVLGTKEWIYGDLIRNNSIIDPFTYIVIGIGYKVDDDRIGKPIRVYPHSVGEYTGLKDKNGKEIYEGDILQISKGIYGLVVWSNELSLFQLRVSLNGEDGGTMTVYSRQERGNNINRELVGNIHDNPDFLKKINHV